MPCDGEIEDVIGWIKQLTNPFCFGINADDAFEGEVREGRVLNYCPVSLTLSNQLVPGKDEFSVQYNHETYKCFDKLSMRRFMSNPEEYLPQEEKNDNLIDTASLAMARLNMFPSSCRTMEVQFENETGFGQAVLFEIEGRRGT